MGAPHRPLSDAACTPAGDANIGKVYIYSGLTGRALRVIPERTTCAGFGHALARLGPIATGPGAEGKAYLAVGAPCEDEQRGHLYVFAISADAVEIVLDLPGEGPGDLFGASVACAGDVDGDGDDEILVGAPGNMAKGTAAGAAYLIDGDGTILDVSRGQGAFEGYGSCVASAGDFDGDGVLDYAAGSQDPRPAGNPAGRVTVRSSAGALLFRRDGTAGERLGVSIASAGDVNGDGFDDLIVGGPHRAPAPVCAPPVAIPPAGPGKAYVILGGDQPPAAGGTAGVVRFAWGGEHEGACFGHAVACVGDLDGDGAGDLLVAAPGTDLGLLSGAGRVYAYSGADGSVLWTLSDDRERAALGRSIAPVGDQDGDGVGDALVGSGFSKGDASLYSLADSDRDGTRDACQSCLHADALMPGAEETFVLTRFIRTRCFQLDPAPGKTLRITVRCADPNDRVSLYARWGAPASPVEYDLSIAGPAVAAPGLIIPAPRAEVLTILVRADTLVADVSEQHIMAEILAGPVLDRMLPGSLRQGDEAGFRAAIFGSRLVPGMGFVLVPDGGGPPYEASDVAVVDPERAEATFDLTGAAIGPFTLLAVLGGKVEADLQEAFVLRPAAGGRELRVTLSDFSAYRNNSLARLTLRIENTGDRPLPAQLFRVIGPPGTRFQFQRDRAVFENEAIGLTYDPRAADGSLSPGDALEIPIWYRTMFTEEECPPGGLKPCTGVYRVELLSPVDSPIAWDRIAAPAGMDGADWQAIRPDLEGCLGSTWGRYRQALSDLMGRLVRRGRFSHSALAPFELAVRAALGRPAGAVTGVVVDDETEAPIGPVAVAAVAGGQVQAYSIAGSDGYFSIDWLWPGVPYTLEVVALGSGSVHPSDTPEVVIPESGDLTGVRIRALRDPGASTLALACPECDPTGLPAAPLVPPPDLFFQEARFEVDVIAAFDPNEKGGSGSQGGDQEIDVDERIEYRIDFENLSGEGGAAARRVEIIDVLDPNLDWTTIQLKDVYLASQPEEIHIRFDGEGADAGGGSCDAYAFGQHPIEGSWFSPANPSVLPSEGPVYGVSACWAGTIQFKYGDDRTADLTLHVSATVEPASDETLYGEEYGVVRWVLYADMGSLVDVDADAGFLAYGCPEDDDAEGLSMCCGYVTFSVAPAANLAAGAMIENDAEIVFDELESVVTDPSSTVTVEERMPSAPCDPGPPSPEEGTTVVPPEGLRFTWMASYATRHAFYLWDASQGDERPNDASGAIVWETDLPEAHYPEGDGTISLDPGKTYRWQVVCASDRGESAPGDVWTFSTSGGEVPFRRGDVNADGLHDLGDAVFVLNYLFASGPAPGCLKAADVNDDGGLDLADPIYDLTYLFAFGPAPAEPFDACGADPTPDDLTCEAYEGCE
ncbi:MAG: FG-GAP repeat protein [Planctomycetes bacterium]|nr:FG-GAP repeat protein [Planctomycetota bacterium]